MVRLNRRDVPSPQREEPFTIVVDPQSVEHCRETWAEPRAELLAVDLSDRFAIDLHHPSDRPPAAAVGQPMVKELHLLDVVDQVQGIEVYVVARAMTDAWDRRHLELVGEFFNDRDRFVDVVQDLVGGERLLPPLDRRRVGQDLERGVANRECELEVLVHPPRRRDLDPHDVIENLVLSAMSVIEGAPEAVLRLEAEYVGGAIVEMHEGLTDGGFGLVDCPRGVFMEVELTISTDDGWLLWTVAADLVGAAPDAMSTIVRGPMTDNLGTLATQPLIYAGEQLDVESLEFWASNLSGGPELSVALYGNTSEGGYYQLAGVFH